MNGISFCQPFLGCMTLTFPQLSLNLWRYYIRKRQKPVLDEVSFLFPLDCITLFGRRTNMFGSQQVISTVSWKAKCLSAVSESCDSMGWDKENPVGFKLFGCTLYANVFQNANTDLWNIDFPYHTHLGLTYVNLPFPFCHIKLFPLEMVKWLYLWG